MSGIWLDANGSAAPFARIDVRNSLRNFHISGSADESGSSEFFLEPGEYDIRVILNSRFVTRTGEAWRFVLLASDAPDISVVALRERARIANEITVSYAEAKAAEVGPPVLSSRYIHNQEIAQEVWPITHGLGVEIPVVTITDTTGNEVEAAVFFHDFNSLSITFGFAVSGKASITA